MHREQRGHCEQERLHKRNDQRTYENLWLWTLMKDKTIMEFLDEGKNISNDNLPRKIEAKNILGF